MPSLQLSRVSLVLALLSTPLAFGCGDDSATGGGSEGGSNAGGAGGGTAAQPIDTPEDEWTWVAFPGTECMDGSETGIAINKGSVTGDVVIFLEGGNACFNKISCAVTANPDGYDADKFAAQGLDDVGNYPYLDRTNPDNPFKDFSVIYVPYCTGDLHAGDRADVEVDGKTRQFHGFSNMTAFLERIVPTFPDAERVVLTGISAGGFGAALNYDHVASAFGASVKTTLIDDSGPPMADPFVPECLQQHLFDTWGFENTLPADCDDCTGAFVEPYVTYLLNKYPDRSMGLISSDADGTISTLLGFGLDDCANLQSTPLPYDPVQYRAGLEDLRDRVGADGRFRLYMLASDEHVWLDNEIGSVTVEGVNLEDWVSDAIAEDPAWANVSAPEAVD